MRKSSSKTTIRVDGLSVTLQKNRHDRSAGDTGISLGAEPSNVRHDPPLSRLRRDWTTLLVKSLVIHEIPMKPAFQGVGSVPGGSAQCNNEVIS